ncbi:MAG TPA: SRPBCC family protein [Lysobacter sp.]
MNDNRPGHAGDDFGVVIAPGTVRIERLLPGPIERIWEYLTDSAKRGTWLASGDMELRAGGRVEHVFRNSELTENDEAPPQKYAQQAGETHMQGRIIACEPPRLLEYGWGEAESDSQVRFELVPHGKDVQLVVTHSRLASRDETLSVAAGWHTHLGILGDRLAGRTPPGFWVTHTRLEAEYAKRIPDHG